MQVNGSDGLIFDTQVLDEGGRFIVQIKGRKIGLIGSLSFTNNEGETYTI